MPALVAAAFFVVLGLAVDPAFFWAAGLFVLLIVIAAFLK